MGGCRLGQHCRLKGKLVSKESIEIDGRFEGDLKADGQHVVVGESARVEATIEAASVAVKGRMRGTVVGRKSASLAKTADMVGKLATVEIRVEEGAVFRGQVDYLGQSRSD